MPIGRGYVRITTKVLYKIILEVGEPLGNGDRVSRHFADSFNIRSGAPLARMDLCL